MKTLDSFDLNGKRVLVRVDFNVPLKDGKVADDTRIRAHLPTINDLIAAGAKVVLVSHLGRPDGKRDSKYSLKPVHAKLETLLGKPVIWADDCIGSIAEKAVKQLNNGDVALLENLRFYAEEEANDVAFSAQLSQLADVYLNDAFATAHRAHASTAGIVSFVSQHGIGRLMQAEMEALSHVLETPKKPLLVIIGGAKISSKIGVLEYLLEKADQMIIGGAMANTFLAAMGHPMGKSLYESDRIETARDIMAQAASRGCRLLLPVDLIGATTFAENAPHDVYDISSLPADRMALDVGPETIEQCRHAIEHAGTILWNGPLGAAETKPFDTATNAIAEAVGASSAYTVAGGGDTIAALNAANAMDKLNYVSTAGGALLEYLEGRPLPALQVLAA